MARLLLVVWLLLPLAMSGAQADDVIDSIDRAKQYYSGGKYSLANQELMFAANQIHDKLADSYAIALPAAPDGWEMDGPNRDNMTVLGGGISVEARYNFSQATDDYNDEYRNVTISIISDSPLLSSVMMLISNPMFMSNGGRAVTVEGNKAVEEWDDEFGKLQFVIDNRILVSVESNGLGTREELHAWAKRINFNHLKQILNS